MGERITIRCKAVLFDMDGTLVDSTQVVERAWAGWASGHGIPLGEVLAFSHGRPTVATFEHFFPGRDHTTELAEMEQHEETRTEGILAIPGAAELLQALEAQRHPWAVVTSAWRALAETRLVAAGLSLPRVMVPVDEIQLGKPHPEGFLKAASLLGIAPGDCVVFEDTRPGIEAGLSGGMQVVGMLTTFNATQLGHHPAIADFRDVRVRVEQDDLSLDVTDRSRDQGSA